MDIDITIEDLGLDNIPTLYDINKSFDVIQTDQHDGIVGEQNARMVVFTNFVLGEKPVILKGSRASGKTNIMTVVGTYCRTPKIISSSSEKVFQRMEELNEHSHFLIPEVNKVNDNVVEMLKDWGEGVPHIYTYTDKFKQPHTVTINPKPFMTSIADENKNVNQLGEELLSRLTVVRTDSSVKQNIAVIEEKLRRAANPRYKKSVDKKKIEEFKTYVHSLPSLSSLKFVYPAETSIRKAIPPIFTDSRRDVGKYLNNTYGICLFHINDRLSMDIDGKKYYFVTPQDIWYNHVIFQDVLLDSSLKCGPIEREILDILKVIGETPVIDKWGKNVKGLSDGEIHTELLKRSYTPTKDSVRKYCESLVDVGYVSRFEEGLPYRFYINPELKREHKMDIDWQEIVDTCKDNVRKNFPEIADEYEKRFCQGDGLVVINPFTGERVVIVDTVEQEVLDVTPEPTVNTKDDLQSSIMSLLEDGSPRSVAQIVSVLGVKDETVDETLLYLKRINEVFEVSPGTFKKL